MSEQSIYNAVYGRGVTGFVLAADNYSDAWTELCERLSEDGEVEDRDDFVTLYHPADGSTETWWIVETFTVAS